MGIQANMDKVVAGLQAVNNRNLLGFTSLLEPGFKLFLMVKPELLMPKGQVSTPEGFAKYLNMLYTAFPKGNFAQKKITANGNMVYQELMLLGVHEGILELPSGVALPATGLKVKLPIEVFHTFNIQGGFICSTGYVNLLDIMHQFKH
jgi:predicted ester cyclase